MKFNLLPKEKIFYELLEKHSDLMKEAASVFLTLIDQWKSNSRESQERVSKLRELEHKCDDIVHQIRVKLNKTFVTPIDREDIYRLSKTMDDVVDILQSVSERMILFHIEQIHPDFIQISKILKECVDLVVLTIYRVRNLEKPHEIVKQCDEISHLESQGDRILEQALGRLFNGETASLEVIKWKELYDALEEGIDKCEDVANAIEGIVVKYG